MAKSCSCNDFTRSQLLRRGAAIAGKGLPQIEPGMPLPAGTGLDRRTFLLRSAGAALSVYGASMLSPRHFEEGIAQASAAGGPNEPVLVSIFMEGGWDALSVLAPVREAKYKELRPVLGLERRLRAGLHRGRNADVASRRRRARRTARRGQGHGLPGDRLRALGREPLHKPPLLGGRPARRQRALRLDGALPRPRRRSRTTRCRASRWTTRWRPRSRRRTMPVAAVSSPADYTMWAYGLGEPITAPALETFGALGALAAPSPAYAQARSASYDTSLVLEEMATSSSPRKNRATSSSVTYPVGRIRRTARGARGDAAHGHADQMRVAERRRLLRHALQRGRHAEPPTSNRRSPRWSPFSATSKRAGWTSAC